MLRSEWQTAIDLVMAPFPDDCGRSDTGERQAREAWAATRDPDAALPHLPRWMGAERRCSRASSSSAHDTTGSAR